MSLVLRSNAKVPTLLSDLLDVDRFFDTDFRDGELFKWTPAVNIKETEKEFDLTFAVPGMNKKDFHVEVENDVLTVSAEKTTEKKEENERFTRREYNYGSFERSFNLPDYVDSTKVDAKYENGLLKLVIPKKKEAIAKKFVKEIPIS
jgi:HSP20 family protein